MQRFIISFSVILVLLACKQQEEKYVNHEKWHAWNSYGYHSGMLKAHPIEVTDSEFSHVSDTVFSKELSAKLIGRFVSIYNDGGDVTTFRAFFGDGLFVTNLHYSYTEQGPQRVSFNADSSKRSEKISRKTGAGKYRSEEFGDDGKLRFIELLTFSNKGRKLVTEKRANGKWIGTDIEYFNTDGRFEHITQKGTLFTSEFHFHYSDKGFLDSIITTNESERSRLFFINNEYGDPVYLEKTKGSIVEEKRWWKYEYDSMHNWVRRIDREESDRPPVISDDKEKFPRYGLVTRLIKYR